MWKLVKVMVLASMALTLLGCVTNADEQTSNADRRTARAVAELEKETDADSLAAAALLNVVKSEDQSLLLINKAVISAPDRADLVWLQIQICNDVPSCDSRVFSDHLKNLDPSNGAVWFTALNQADSARDDTAKQLALDAISHSERVDTYWTTLVSHLSSAIAQTKILSIQSAQVRVAGILGAQALPAYTVISVGCKGERLNAPNAIETCRGVANALEQGDTYITEMIGVAIAKRVWPDNSPQWKAATEARRVFEYRSKLIGALNMVDQVRAQRYLSLCLTNRREQDIYRAFLIAEGKNPFPPT